MIDQLTKLEPIDISRENIRLAAAIRNLNLAEVARRADLSRNAVSQFVAGRTSLSYANTLKVCEVLDVPIGIMHSRNAITPGHVRLAKALDRLPAHLAMQALEAVNIEIDTKPDL